MRNIRYLLWLILLTFFMECSVSKKQGSVKPEEPEPVKKEAVKLYSWQVFQPRMDSIAKTSENLRKSIQAIDTLIKLRASARKSRPSSNYDSSEERQKNLEKDVKQQQASKKSRTSSIYDSSEEFKTKVEEDVKDKQYQQKLAELIKKLEEVKRILEYLTKKIENRENITEEERTQYLQAMDECDELHENITHCSKNVYSNLLDNNKGWILHILFEKGKYEISDLTLEEMDEIKQFLDDIVKFHKSQSEIIKGDNLVIHISTKGYADDTDFRQPYQSNEVVQDLLSKNSNPPIPHGGEGRQFLNELLSKARAESLNNYIKQELIKLGYKESLINLYVKSYGEQPPFGEKQATRTAKVDMWVVYKDFPD